MIKQEEVIIGGNKFIHTYSDKQMYILQVETGIKYDEAYIWNKFLLLLNKLQLLLAFFLKTLLMKMAIPINRRSYNEVA